MSLATYYRQFFWKSIEMGIVPDFYLRSKIRANLEVQLSDLKGNGNMEDQQERLSQFLAEIKAMPIAINQANANEQHYEVPSEFYLKQLGPCLKYSCGYWPNENTTLEESETIIVRFIYYGRHKKRQKIRWWLCKHVGITRASAASSSSST